MERKKKEVEKLPNLSHLTPQEIAKVMLNTPPEKKPTKKNKTKKR